MSRAFLAALAAVAFAFGITFSAPASAATLPECNNGNLWSVESIQIDFPTGFTIDYYLCVPGGWLLVGSIACLDGNCSSD